jgi:hypothetical protein
MHARMRRCLLLGIVLTNAACQAIAGIEDLELTAAPNVVGHDGGTAQQDAGSDGRELDASTVRDGPAPFDSAMDAGRITDADSGTGPGIEGGQDGGDDAAEELPPCAAAYAVANCLAYIIGAEVSMNSRNWICSGACANCSTNSRCAPGRTGCPWGVVWTDDGACH